MTNDHLQPHKLGSVSLESANSIEPEAFVVKDLREFQDAIAEAQMTDRKFIEVDQKVFDYFTRRKQTKYFVYGNPSVRVYLVGTRDEIERDETRLLL